MPRRRERRQRPARPGDHRALADPPVRAEARRRSPRRRRSRPPPPAAPSPGSSRRPGRRAPAPARRPAPRRRRAPALWSRWAWVTSTAATRSPATAAASAREVPRIVRPRVDHRHLALADDVAPRAGEGHRPGVRRRHDPQPRRQRLGHADRRRVAQIERARPCAPSLRASRTARNPRAHGLPPLRSFLPRSLFGRALTILLVPIVVAATRRRAGLLPAPLPARHRADDPQRRLRARLRGGARSRPPATRRRRRCASPSSRRPLDLWLRLEPGATARARASSATSSTSPARRWSRPSQATFREPLAHRPLRRAQRGASVSRPASACSRPPSRATGCRSRTRTSSSS